MKFCVEALTVLRLVPGNGRPFNPKRPGGMRELLFGADGEGSVVYILLVQWLSLGA